MLVVGLGICAVVLAVVRWLGWRPIVIGLVEIEVVQRVSGRVREQRLVVAVVHGRVVLRSQYWDLEHLLCVLVSGHVLRLLG